MVLCLPDEASKQANDWLDESGNDSTVLIDASTAFRVDPTFTYGFPELCKEQRAAIAKSKVRIEEKRRQRALSAALHGKLTPLTHRFAPRHRRGYPTPAATLLDSWA